jgi:gamma-glutamylcyclotransferase
VGAIASALQNLAEQSRSAPYDHEMIYFAYGSNMLTQRLQQRVPSAWALGVGSVPSRCLRFHKRSKDGSGKCDLAVTAEPSAVAYGVLFTVPDEERPVLDQAEGLGYGYREEALQVVGADRQIISAIAYVATPQGIEVDRQPYNWYHRLVISGARQHALPESYVAGILNVHAIPDPDLTRPTYLEAIAALRAAGVDCDDLT